MVNVLVDIPGYEGLYAATMDGKIWSYKSSQFLVPALQPNGRMKVWLYKDNKRKNCSVHRLILMTFNPIDGMDKMTVNHKDENPQNNCLNNLEWMTIKENNTYGTRIERAAKANAIANLNNPKRSKKIMCIETDIVYPSTHEASRRTNIDQSHICKAAKSAGRKMAGGFHWKYVD